MGPKKTLFKGKIWNIPLALLNMKVLVTNFKMEMEIEQMCQIIILGLLNTTYLTFNTTYQNYKKHVFKSKLWPYLAMQIWSDYFQVIMWTAVEETPNNSTGLPYTT